jgi:vitamin B12 transporter
VIVEPLDGLVLTGGGRIDNHSTFGAYDTHRLTAAYLLKETDTKFHASYGTGFRAPSLYELFSTPYGNPNLTPETSKSWDAGIEQGFLRNQFGIGATYFEIEMTDKIDFVSLPCFCPPFGFYDQVPGLTRTSGVELSAFAKLAPNAVLNAGYTYQDSEEPDGTRAIRLPRHSLVVGLTAQPIEKLSLNVTGQYVADSLDGADIPVDDYFLLSAKVGYEVLPGTVAYVRGENLLDQNYTTVINYANPGLAVYGGVQFALPAN